MFKTVISALSVLLLAFGLVACGGGGGGDGSATKVATATLTLPQQLEVVTNEN
ncbi:hypothetical protein [Vibrio sp. SCSIO 43137]|uniref:hypothetical protein n=1 Tax=Vibrio sp. SCSIO 43137 TaxID=3021011 RepID=UPI0023073EB3|nr:hypothetical protein [Vibrio sp. SCSIO 43137]WCE30343.1 hypothetical protein PK654_03390 [Vibrio sp. SCSIO 43137]